MEKYLGREGVVKTQVIMSVSDSLALILQKKSTAKELWDALVTEMTKKPRMVITSLQRQLRNIKCSEEDDLQEHLDKAQDLYSSLNEMGALISEEKFMDIILASCPTSNYIPFLFQPVWVLTLHSSTCLETFINSVSHAFTKRVPITMSHSLGIDTMIMVWKVGSSIFPLEC